MEAYRLFEHTLGLNLQPGQLNALQISLRGITVFIATIILIRVGNKRFLAKLSAFDAVLALVLASSLARAINGSAPLFPTLIMALVLVLMHRALAALTFYWGWLGKLLKGEADVLVESAHPQPEKLRRHKISEQDLLEEARLKGKVGALGQIQTAVLERSGEISIIPCK